MKKDNEKKNLIGKGILSKKLVLLVSAAVIIVGSFSFIMMDNNDGYKQYKREYVYSKDKNSVLHVENPSKTAGVGNQKIRKVADAEDLIHQVENKIAKAPKKADENNINWELSEKLNESIGENLNTVYADKFKEDLIDVALGKLNAVELKEKYNKIEEENGYLYTYYHEAIGEDAKARVNNIRISTVKCNSNDIDDLKEAYKLMDYNINSNLDAYNQYYTETLIINDGEYNKLVKLSISVYI